jgi:hypothetical protein
MSPTRLSTLAITLALVLNSAFDAAGESAPDEKEAFFEKRIRPVLVEQCFKCHSKGSEKTEGGLRLDSRQALIRGGDTGPAIDEKNAEASLLIRALHYSPDELQMPPKGKLPVRIIADFEKWVNEGALWPNSEEIGDDPGKSKFTITDKQREHWSFKPIQAQTPPEITATSTTDRLWNQHNIDRFVFARQQMAGVSANQLADKRTLIRRATFDLTGLPPTADEISQFLADESDDAFAKVIDRLLASDRYGERWGRHWLDGVRYVQEVGWYTRHDLGGRYRDWVIESLNIDMPYNEFVKYQLAGDLIPSPTGSKNNPWGIVATGVLAMGNYDDQETEKETLYGEIVDDQIDLVSRQIMGLTVSCARCHDHKFDPISTKDYYALAGIFHSCRVLNYKRIAGPRIEVEILDQAQKEHYQRQQEEYKKLRQQLADSNPLPTDDREKLKTQLAELRRVMLPAPGKTLGVIEGGYEKGMHTGVGDAHLYIRGNFKSIGSKVPRQFPVVLAGDKQTPIGETTKQSGRLELAEWLVREDHPLTPRVIANRIWLYHFGEGIVRTPSNFGFRGDAPTHPELLDYLATRLIESGWSLKTLHREIMLSSTYRQAASVDTKRVEQDPENRLFSRFRSRRLSAEEIYDNLLTVSGKLGGKNRAVYQPLGHEKPWYFGRIFDAPPVNTMIPQRSVSTVSPQALFMMNDSFVIDAAKSISSRANNKGKVDERIDWVFQLLYARQPTDDERQWAREYLESVADEQAWTYYQVLLCANEFIYVD